nr:SAM-dependent chlorinase/fluorinase [Actinorhabdospora filicis]
MHVDPVISLTTDYGLADGFAGVCHGVIAGIAPTARVIDVTHEVPPGDVRRGAHVLAQSLPYLPAGGVHVGVVDPGVGTVRHPLALATPRGVLIGPDNGLLVWAAEALGGVTQAIALSNDAWHRHPVSRTFHGRDVFAPVAAHVAGGVALTDLGDPLRIGDLVRLPEPRVTAVDDGVDAEVLTVDRFGNVQLAASPSLLDELGEKLTVNGWDASRGDVFATAPTGGLVVLGDSAGRAAITVNGGSAAAVLSVAPGDVVRVRAAG